MTEEPSTAQASTETHEHRLSRSCSDRLLGGVAGGIAEYLDVDPTIVRVGFAALSLFGGAALPLYAAAWLLVPEECSGESIADQFLHRHQVA